MRPCLRREERFLHADLRGPDPQNASTRLQGLFDAAERTGCQIPQSVYENNTNPSVDNRDELNIRDRSISQSMKVLSQATVVHPREHHARFPGK